MDRIYSTEGSYYEAWFFFHHKTAKAILISTSGQKCDAVWLPLSQCVGEPIPIMEGEAPEVEICIPEWLAVEKGLV